MVVEAEGVVMTWIEDIAVAEIKCSAAVIAVQSGNFILLLLTGAYRIPVAFGGWRARVAGPRPVDTAYDRSPAGHVRSDRKPWRCQKQHRERGK